MTLSSAFVLMFVCFSIGFQMGLRRAWRDMTPNDPSSATASAARAERTVRSRTPAMLERTAERPFAAAPG